MVGEDKPEYVRNIFLSDIGGSEEMPYDYNPEVFSHAVKNLVEAYEDKSDIESISKIEMELSTMGEFQ